MAVETVGVVGAGVMGVGVAQDVAQAGLQVVLTDLTEEILQRGKEEIHLGLRMQGFFRARDEIGDPDEVMGRIRYSTNPEALGEADFLVENVTEKWEAKEGVFRELDGICPERCVFASNTSAIPITRIASVTERADRVIGIHFMNPVPLKDTVEVIRAVHTSEDTLEATLGFLALLGKEGIVVNDSPGFVSNRVLMLTVNEAIFALHDQVASAAQIDSVFTSCFGHKMGPLATADMIGLDTILLSLEVLLDSFKDTKFRPCPLLVRMVHAGHLGKKSGRGFFDYGG